jgi:tRNA(Ile)-lysidine synthase
VSNLAASTLASIRRHRMLRPGDRVGVAVSGGADSVALLRILLTLRSELGITLSAVHFNHRIRGAEADLDQDFVSALARTLDVEFHYSSADTPAHAGESRLGLEAAARDLRYQYFRHLLSSGAVHRIATAHTRDDQAETVLLRFLRGSGTRGLAGIYPVLIPGIDSSAANPSHPPAIVRPLLEAGREELRLYLKDLDQVWREDASNTELKFTRNRIRHALIPILERDYNPALQQVLAESAEVARAEEQFWTQETDRQMNALLYTPPQPAPAQTASLSAPPPLALRLDPLRLQPLALQRRLVRAAAESLGLQLDFHHVEQILSLVENPTGEAKLVELPHCVLARVVDGTLSFHPPCSQSLPGSQSFKVTGFDYSLAVPGMILIPELGSSIHASMVPAGEHSSNPLLDPAQLGSNLRVRSWRAGDRYWPAHTKNSKKLKELLQSDHISKQLKDLWPVVLSGERIVWVPGFDFPRDLRLSGSSAGVLLEYRGSTQV